MNQSYFESKTRSLTLDIIRTCWWIIAIYIAGTGVNSWLSGYDDPWSFLRDVTVIPGMKMIVLWIGLECYFRWMNQYLNYMTILFTNFLVVIMILSLFTLPITVYFLIFPILFSLFYFRVEIILFSIVQALFTLLLLYFFSSNIQAMLTPSDILMLVAMMTASALIINKLRKHAFSLAEHLAKAIQEKQDYQMANIQMERISRIESVTELYNHKTFHEHLENLMSLQQSFPIAVHLALLDIDNFKQVNDTYGHAAGDVIIKYVADQIKAHLVTDDFASRYGGEEFGVICVEKTREKVFEQLEEIRRAISSSVHEVLAGNRITISIGVQKLHPGMTKDQLFQAADDALYTAKRSGKNQTVLGRAE
jgi:diguanylate cyclase (GGDEF)-like protein